MMYSPDFLRRARQIVFYQVNTLEFLTILAQRSATEVSWWAVGMRQPLQTHRITQSAEGLGLFDGRAWNLTALERWVRRHCRVCWGTLQSDRQTYCSNKCRQSAYRKRIKMIEGLYPKYTVVKTETGETVSGVFVLKPEKDIHARIALLAYSQSVQFENPTLAQDLDAWLAMLNESPLIQVSIRRSDELPEWIIEQSRTQG